MTLSVPCQKAFGLFTPCHVFKKKDLNLCYNGLHKIFNLLDCYLKYSTFQNENVIFPYGSSTATATVLCCSEYKVNSI